MALVFRLRSDYLGRVTTLLLKRKEVIAVFYTTENGNSEESTSSVNNETNYNETVSRDNSINQFFGASQKPFPKEITKILLAPVNNDDIEIKPDGLLYLPEIKYRRILNKSFGPGAWALIPRGESLQFQNEKDKSQLITREYALFCLGRYVSQAVGEHTFYGQGNMVYGKAMEAARSNALVRCCKDLGIASELWDPKFVMEWKEKYSKSVWCEHSLTSDKRKLWFRSDHNSSTAIPYPWKPISGSSR